MAIYVIGDVHGCIKTLISLVDQLDLKKNDELWFCGDLVNRGPDSTNCIRFIKALKIKTVCVLGNHDLYLLSLVGDNSKMSGDCGIQALLEAPDKNELIEWLRHRPLAHVSGKYILVHAGVYPTWDTATIKELALEIENDLQSATWQRFMVNLWGNSPGIWNSELEGKDRKRIIVNIFTRMRYLTPTGALDFSFKNTPSVQAKTLVPWFCFSKTLRRKERVLFGHWSSLGLLIRKEFVSLDTGCGRGEFLTAIRLSDSHVYSKKVIDDMPLTS
tara:strand:- start:1271 stop:2089 length:819 start_codon:yes stop_codon:yes gene_type:complete